MIILDTIDASKPGMFVSSNVPENDFPALNLTKVYAAADKVMDAAAHLVYESKVGVRAEVAISIASPAVVTWTAHGLVVDTPISFATTSALPTGLVAGTAYYVRAPTTNSFNLSATPGGAAIATTGTQSGVHTATAGQNIGRPLTDKTYWLPAGATNRWKMLDAYNNTQTENPESIVLVLKPQAIAQALYLGNMDVDQITIESTDPVAGLVHTETSSLIISNSASSFYNWCFKRIRRRRQFCTLDLPLYHAASITITLSKPGGIAKCGMCCLGPLEDVGLSQYGLAADIKDYSSTKFNFDGTSETTLRGYSKRMTLDLVLDNDVVDSVHERLLDFRQKTVVFIGAKQFDLSLVCGTYASFRTVIEGFTHSKIAMQIDGKV